MSCPICFNQNVSFCIIPCGHCLCKICIKKVSDCPMCRGSILKTQRLYLESKEYSPENNFINLNIYNFEFLKESSPKKSNKITDLGLAFAPLFKAIEFNPTFEELKIILKFFVPTINIDSEVTILMNILPQFFIDYFYSTMLKRFQMIKIYGNKFLVNTLNPIELKKINNNKIKNWLNQYNFVNYPGEAVLQNYEIKLKPKLDKREHILNRQLEILNSKSDITIKRMALLTMRQLYKLDLNGSLPVSSEDDNLDSISEIHSSDDSIDFESNSIEITNNILSDLSFEQDGLVFE